MIFVAVLLTSDLAGPSVGDEVATPFLAVLFLFYSIGRYTEGRMFWAAAGFLVLGLLALLIADSGGAGDFLYVLAARVHAGACGTCGAEPRAAPASSSAIKAAPARGGPRGARAARGRG